MLLLSTSQQLRPWSEWTSSPLHSECQDYHFYKVEPPHSEADLKAVDDYNMKEAASKQQVGHTWLAFGS